MHVIWWCVNYCSRSTSSSVFSKKTGWVVVSTAVYVCVEKQSRVGSCLRSYCLITVQFLFRYIFMWDCSMIEIKMCWRAELCICAMLKIKANKSLQKMFAKTVAKKQRFAISFVKHCLRTSSLWICFAVRNFSSFCSSNKKIYIEYS